MTPKITKSPLFHTYLQSEDVLCLGSKTLQHPVFLVCEKVMMNTYDQMLCLDEVFQAAQMKTNHSQLG